MDLPSEESDFNYSKNSDDDAMELDDAEGSDEDEKITKSKHKKEKKSKNN